MRKYRYMDIIESGDLFDDAFAITPIHSGPGVDHVSTHINRDKVLIATLRQWGEILMNGIAEPRDAGKRLMELAEEAEDIEKEVSFGYNR
jgi:hypothetical protein